MIKHKIIVILAVSLILSSCNEDDSIKLSKEDKNLEKISIQSGLTGTLKEIKGNCMPMLDDSGNSSSCIESVVQDTIVIHELTSWNQLVGQEVFYDSIMSERVATVVSDSEGFYEVNLEQGQYSIFIIHENKYFASRGTSDGVNPVMIGADSLTIFHPLLDLAVY